MRGSEAVGLDSSIVSFFYVTRGRVRLDQCLVLLSIKLRERFARPEAMRCRKHGVCPIDVWYDCEQCLNESFRWAKRNAFTHCVSPYVKCPGSDNGEWVRKNMARWVNTDAPAAGGSSDPGASPRPGESCP